MQQHIQMKPQLLPHMSLTDTSPSGDELTQLTELPPPGYSTWCAVVPTAGTLGCWAFQGQHNSVGLFSAASEVVESGGGGVGGVLICSYCA